MVWWSVKSTKFTVSYADISIIQNYVATKDAFLPNFLRVNAPATRPIRETLSELSNLIQSSYVGLLP